jgi:protocatechuate 3,4-dioxygenase alpha subunit
LTESLSTPSQTVGPFLSIGLPWPGGERAVPEGTPGEIRIGGRIYDGDGELVPDAMVEVWGPDSDGNFADMHGHGGESKVDGFRGFARSGYEEGDGTWQVFTLKPGPVPKAEGDGTQAPHLDVSVFARGMLNRCVTRIYFGDDAAANAHDPVLATVPEDRRHTLIAEPSADGDGYEFDIRLQGDGETVFFEL